MIRKAQKRVIGKIRAHTLSGHYCRLEESKDFGVPLFLDQKPGGNTWRPPTNSVFCTFSGFGVLGMLFDVFQNFQFFDQPTFDIGTWALREQRGRDTVDVMQYEVVGEWSCWEGMI